MDACVSDSFKKLLGIVSAGARGQVYEGSDIDWNEIVRLALEHSVCSLVGCTLLTNPFLVCPDNIRTGFIEQMRMQSSLNVIRRQRILSLISEMGQKGISTKVLKGYTLANCYAYPESRESVDTDLLIDINDEAHAIAMFRDKGFKVERRNVTSHHSVCQHKKYGIVELHVELFDELVRDVWLKKSTTGVVLETTRHIQLDDGEYETLGYTDHMIFLVLHMVKHFISHGLSVGMMLDLAVYCERHYAQIDMARLWSTLEQGQLSSFVSVVFQIMVDYGGFPPSLFVGMQHVSNNQVDLVLSDLERGGRMGIKEADVRKMAGKQYSKLWLLRSQNRLHYYCYMYVWKIRRFISALHPDDEISQARSPSHGQKCLLHYAYILKNTFTNLLRKLDGHMKHNRTKKRSITINADVAHRVELFRTLGML